MLLESSWHGFKAPSAAKTQTAEKTQHKRSAGTLLSVHTAASDAVSVMDYSLNTEAAKEGDGQEVKGYHPWLDARDHGQGKTQTKTIKELFESQ